MNAEKLRHTVKAVTDLLAQRAFAELEKLSNGRRLQASEIQTAVEKYGCTIVSLPAAAYVELDVVKVNGVEPTQWSVDVPVYTLEEGRSDLTLQLTLIHTQSELYRVEVDNLHVL